uniref:Uncharacterized protein n=1 Tax=Chromera velia CCMP2878 TaxID=1169474 RepID=A0A0G4FW82_9ALVE|eukprot:Cvel_470.t1-p1 / transcript=Cvel_470.t1 / gene=Cvel_470 / organism=Chromera_velia_CCMP2878 / gene_product=hypothetical protein / transcript_product=hypothetical protein / location=Cvel_scaffold15:26288-28815(+) / protein_length=623 / sequence_SO=supercontig / SO=protein_coding / is_pseudo=false
MVRLPLLQALASLLTTVWRCAAIRGLLRQQAEQQTTFEPSPSLFVDENQLRDYFDKRPVPVIWINLPESTERAAQFRSQLGLLKGLGLDPRRSPAVSARDVARGQTSAAALTVEGDDFDRQTVQLPESFLTYKFLWPTGCPGTTKPEEKATVFSHLFAIKAAFDSGDSLAVIAEDDASFAPFKQIVNARSGGETAAELLRERFRASQEAACRQAPGAYKDPEEVPMVLQMFHGSPVFFDKTQIPTLKDPSTYRYSLGAHAHAQKEQKATDTMVRFDNLPVASALTQFRGIRGDDWTWGATAYALNRSAMRLLIEKYFRLASPESPVVLVDVGSFPGLSPDFNGTARTGGVRPNCVADEIVYAPPLHVETSVVPLVIPSGVPSTIHVDEAATKRAQEALQRYVTGILLVWREILREEGGESEEPSEESAGSQAGVEAEGGQSDREGEREREGDGEEDVDDRGKESAENRVGLHTPRGEAWRDEDGGTDGSSGVSRDTAGATPLSQEEVENKARRTAHQRLLKRRGHRLARARRTLVDWAESVTISIIWVAIFLLSGLGVAGLSLVGGWIRHGGKFKSGSSGKKRERGLGAREGGESHLNSSAAEGEGGAVDSEGLLWLQIKSWG